MFLHKIKANERTRKIELENKNLLWRIFSINQGRVKQRKISLKFALWQKKTVHNDEKWHYHRNELNNVVIIQGMENAMLLLQHVFL